MSRKLIELDKQLAVLKRRSTERQASCRVLRALRTLCFALVLLDSTLGVDVIRSVRCTRSAVAVARDADNIIAIGVLTIILCFPQHPRIWLLVAGPLV